MSNDESQDFVERIRIGGDELFFWYRKQKFMLQWWYDNEIQVPTLLLERLTEPGDWLVWEEKLQDTTIDIVVEKFLRAEIWDNRTFWDAYPEMEWVDEQDKTTEVHS